MSRERGYIRANGITKRYGEGENAVVALDDVSVEFAKGEFTAIMGASGSGKSTLMQCMAGLDAVTSGQIQLGETELSGLSDDEITEIRRDRMGFVFQAFNLLPALNAEQNITLPHRLAGTRVDRARFDQLVSMLGIVDRLDHRPAELSGGQQQRVAIARALIHSPEIVFCDEPTGALDSRSGEQVLRFLRESVDTFGVTVVMVTHSATAAAWSDRVVFLADGQISGEDTNPSVESVLAVIGGVGGRS
ncbi:MAG: ABC transporter ATP-binding protein [Thermomicrobiales bacterium]|nr:ABC transporter ATP-binding protein [Thermomicrobiales bacterium]